MREFLVSLGVHCVVVGSVFPCRTSQSCMVFGDGCEPNRPWMGHREPMCNHNTSLGSRAFPDCTTFLGTPKCVLLPVVDVRDLRQGWAKNAENLTSTKAGPQAWMSSTHSRT